MNGQNLGYNEAGEGNKLLDKSTMELSSPSSGEEPIDYKIRLNVSSPRRFVNRKNSVILADTGERVQRSITLSQSQDSEQMLDMEQQFFMPPNRFNRFISPFVALFQNDTFKSVTKCTIAYFIASLGVFYTPFDEFLGSTDSKHVIATVAVYFHPTRTRGSMNQTIIFVVISLLYSVVVSFGCRLISSSFFTHGQDETSHAIDLLVSSVALGVVSFWKQKVNKQTFNTACSLACISIVACIVKEGSKNSGDIPLDRIEATFKVVVSGCFISFGCCYLIWPTSATKLLQATLSQSCQNYSPVLLTLTRRFIAGEQLNKKDLQLVDNLKKNVNLLSQYLEEAKYELRLVGKEEEWQYYKSLVSTTVSLARHLQALSSATRMQWSLLNSGLSDNDNNNNTSGTSTLQSYSIDELGGSQLLEEINDFRPRALAEEEVDVATSLQLFDLFVYHLSPSIKSLVFTIKDVLVRAPFNENGHREPDTQTLKSALERAIAMYEKRQELSFEHIYNQESFNQNSDIQFKTDQEKVAACCGNFATLLSQFATELLKCVEIFERYEHAKGKPRSWPWLRRAQYNSLTNSYTQDTSLHAALDDLKEQYGLPMEKPVFSSIWEEISYKIWQSIKYFKRTDVQFGIRVGLGAAALSVFAFVPETRMFFENWRLEWALTVYCIMMNKSLGGTTMTVKWRILGTFLGAFVAFSVWNIFNANVYCLALAGIVVSVPSFYIILFWKQNNAFGRFILLTYNLSMLYSYSMIQKDSEDDMEGGENPIIGEIAFHRFAAVSIGIIWALTMATCFLPNSARVRLKNGLSVLWLRLGVIWNSDPLEYNPSSMTLVGFKAEEGTNKILSECETLLKQAPVEYRFKGKFQTQIYSKLLKETSAIIDAFQNLDLLIKVDPTLTPNEEYVLKYIEIERSEVEQRIFLVFYMIASAMKLGFSLPKKFASIEHAKDRMLYKLSEIRQQQEGGLHLKNSDFILLYSYLLVASDVSTSLDNILVQIKELLGEISEDKFRLV
ncbi:hypothetical protein KGF56_001855 [Candida oxycetoniae]|uniref:DUF2421 domain-containing protein n=1 Tax=Candida oxycetoniae TaxID=497107 RepID=A0AAI9SYC6_9ASCO|nr:uncharacterized protein KGF56_001855 [Candida oxycetoniae]KAI3405358.2 hypothetical protein KGF56_001855 [Candida oxycetoniae]